ncbi:MAG: hypothetical protein JNL11_11915 [Bdellovibrionaceae bacterium]|nr:hypothetical protein [Pseudobdellovibrionaceae bacterium]
MISKLVDLLKYAPSGGNLQPWVLKIVQTNTNTNMTISLDPKIRFEQQHTDHCGYGALISLGVLSYSVQYLCQNFGYLFANRLIHSDTDLYKNFISIDLEKCDPIQTPRPQIFRYRFTDRRPYEKKPLPPSLTETLKSDYDTSLLFFDEARARKLVTSVFTQLSLIRFQNKSLFKELSHELKSDDRETTGIPISNLGVSWVLSLVTRLQKKFPHILPFAAAYSWPLYESIVRPMTHAATMACLKQPGNSPDSWIRLGEKFMHIWLEVSESGMRLQPFGNTLSIANYFQDPSFFSFSKKQIERVKSLHSKILTELNVDTAEACLFFRIGYSNLEPQETPRKDISFL